MKNNVNTVQFEKVYSLLNTEQQKAVDAIYGPVLVIAGPGTGKTQMLSVRIANILKHTDALPTDILCVTFTDAGRTAMRQRLLNIIGMDAFKVHIHTFHSFCNQIIQEHSHKFPKNNLTLLSPLDEIEMFRELINQLPQNNPLKRMQGDPYFETKRLPWLFKIMRQEGWSSDYIKGQIKRHIDSLYTDETYVAKRKIKSTIQPGVIFEKGDIRTDKIQQLDDEFNILRSAADAFDTYTSMIQKSNFYTYDDMILWVNDLLKKDYTFRMDYLEKFQFLLVDEFQDTNGAQNELLYLLTDDEQPNIFAVGDDDQGIFRFQGANMQNIYEFVERYGNKIQRVVLKENYRSVQKY
jgi:Superfamily I DNA and RNA helicases